jgi:hypothetical protein
MKTDGKLRLLLSGEWAIQLSGREPVRVLPGEVFIVEVAGKMKRTRLAQRADGKYHSTTGLELRDGMRARFFVQRNIIKGDSAKTNENCPKSTGGTLVRVRTAYDRPSRRHGREHQASAPGSERIVRQKKRLTDADQLAYYAVRLLEITAELRPYGERALNLSRDEAWDVRTELLTVVKRLRAVQERLMDRVYKDKAWR